MANVKITELTELVAPQKSDVILVVDTLNDQTKKAVSRIYLQPALMTAPIESRKVVE